MGGAGPLRGFTHVYTFVDTKCVYILVYTFFYKYIYSHIRLYTDISQYIYEELKIWGVGAGGENFKILEKMATFRFSDIANYNMPKYLLFLSIFRLNSSSRLQSGTRLDWKFERRTFSLVGKKTLLSLTDEAVVAHFWAAGRSNSQSSRVPDCVGSSFLATTASLREFWAL